MITPTGNRVLVLPTSTTQEHPSGLILTSDNSRHVQGRVVAVGPKADSQLKDKQVLFNKGSGSPIHIEQADYVLLAESDLLGVFDD